MEAARAWSVPRSVFLGRVVGPGESLFTDDDREWALALLEYEADLCACGQPRSESMEGRNEFLVYRAEKRRCHACKEIARASELWATPGGEAHGLYISLTKTGRGHD